MHRAGSDTFVKTEADFFKRDPQSALHSQKQLGKKKTSYGRHYNRLRAQVPKIDNHYSNHLRNFYVGLISTYEPIKFGALKIGQKSGGPKADNYSVFGT